MKINGGCEKEKERERKSEERNNRRDFRTKEIRGLVRATRGLAYDEESK